MSDLCAMKAIDSIRLNQLIRERRSVKPIHFNQGRPVPGEVTRQALYHATQTAIHGNSQPWKCIVYKDTDRWNQTSFKVHYTTGKRRKIYPGEIRVSTNNAPKVSRTIAICCQRDPTLKIPEPEEIKAVACTVQNMALTIAASGMLDCGHRWCCLLPCW